jgi:O-Antigen ligase
VTTLGVAVQERTGRFQLEHIAPAALGLALVGVTARADGGFEHTVWPLAILGPLLAVSAVMTLVKRTEVGRLDALLLGTLGVVALWTVTSALWSDSVPRTIWDAERDLVYISAVLALLVLTTKRGVAPLAMGVAAAVTATCLYALATRLFPDRLGLHIDYRNQLSGTIGYSNGLGFFAATGIVLALAVVASASRMTIRAVVSAAVVPLVGTLYFTFSRGAWLALMLALAVALAVDPARRRLAVTAATFVPSVAVTAWLCSRFHALSVINPTLPSATHDGHRLAVLLALTALVTGAAPFAADRFDVRLRPLSAYAWARLCSGLLVLALVVGVAALMRAGGPGRVWDRVSSSFGTTRYSPNTNLGHRLFTISGHNRVDYWHVAWSDAVAHPWFGSGAGTFGLYWTRNRPIDVGALDSHSMYLEALSELGVVGLVLLCLFLAVPLVALRRARGRPWVAVAAGVYVAFLADAGVDWFWELPAVTLLALCFGAMLVVSARGEGEWKVSRGARGAALAAVAAAAAVAVIVQAGNQALQTSRTDAGSGRYAAAAQAARRAIRLAPWSADGWESLAQIQQDQGDIAAARSSFRRAIAKDPLNWTLWNELALVSSGNARAEAAAKVRSLNPLAPNIPRH